MNRFAENLKELRTKQRIYQREMAEYLQVSVGTYQNYEKGIHEPGIDKLIALADYFQVTLDDLVGHTKNA
ncbi:helix-turn-helix domain-containing protein [uncultured Dysosmobacter sp.]|uniref:helix-turn-helix domain-containing protein n=1 Tax=uncultured Dysosmobacter sp. TaxID=2591384 RepID=UPI002629438C|nr:helix-turn-helix transcriptional regulator [uncultured Dysosmobacter sp.]